MKTITLTGKSVYTEIIKIKNRSLGIDGQAAYQFGESVICPSVVDAFFKHYDEGDIYTVTLEEIESTKSFKIISYMTKCEKEMMELMCAEQ